MSMHAPARCSTPRRRRAAPWLVWMALLLMAMELGGSLYERLVLDPAWPDNMALIQPDGGGVNRKVFWMPLHGFVMLLLPVALWASWSNRLIRRWLLTATGIYAAMRIWTFAYFVPRAMRFEDADVDANALAGEARDWVLLSALRTPMIVATVAALWLAARQLDRPPSSSTALPEYDTEAAP